MNGIGFAGQYRVSPQVAHQRNVRGQKGDDYLAEVYRTLNETGLGDRIRKLDRDLTMYYDTIVQRCGVSDCRPDDCPTGRFEVDHPIRDKILALKERGSSRTETRLSKQPGQSIQSFIEEAVSREEALRR